MSSVWNDEVKPRSSLSLVVFHFLRHCIPHNSPVPTSYTISCYLFKVQIEVLLPSTGCCHLRDSRLVHMSAQMDHVDA